jgi:glutathione synthase/RimK-type ligase-like ATP-grasp enzyme
VLAIVASEFDIHTDAVILALRERGFSDVLRIDFESALDRFKFSMQISDENFNADLQGQDAILHNLAKVRTVWWRRSSSQIGVDYLNIPPPDQLDQAEAYWATRWLLESLPAASFPLGHPYTLRAGENKLTQLRTAPLAGLRPPASLVSNNESELKSFLKNHLEVVVKPLHTPVVPDVDGKDLSIIARSVKSSELQELIIEAQKTCLFIQERVMKLYDVRVNIFPNRVVACRIDPAPGADEVDWRPETNRCPHSIIELPSSIAEACRRFLRMMGLAWGAFDFGVTEDNEWVFFECNPNGQWLWIELHTKYPLSGIVADELLAHHSSHQSSHQ